MSKEFWGTTMWQKSNALLKLKWKDFMWNSYILVRQADPEREAICLSNELHMCMVLQVVDTRQVASTLITLFQSLVPTQLLGYDLIV